MKGFREQSRSNKKSNKKTKPSKEHILNQAFRFHSQGNISEAAKYYQYFINQGFNDHRVLSNYGVIYKDLGKLQDAELSTRKAIELKPDYAEAHSNLGNILRDLGNLQDAELSTRNAIGLKPNYAEAHSNLGNILRDLGNLQDAELSTRKAIQLKPDYAEAYSNLGLILKDLGNLQEAEVSIRKAIELKPAYAEAHNKLANILVDLGELHEAELSTRKAIQLKPNYAEAYSNLGNILRNLDKLHEAELSTRKAIQLKPNYADAHSNLGTILKDLGKLKDAEVSTRKAIQLKPNYADAHSNLGNTLRDLGKLKELILLSESTLESRSINKGFKLIASVRITITYLLQKDFSKMLLSINQTKKLINEGAINTIKDEKNKKHLFTFSQFINSLYPLLEKENNNTKELKIPHFGESHCLSFAHQNLSISSHMKQIQPVLIAGGKAWHFANKKNNQWKDSLTQQIKNHTYSNKVFISFGEIDCRKDEGIINYAIKNDKNISVVCETTINGFLNHMETSLSPYYSKRYYFGVPAPTREKELLDELDIKRIETVRLYNYIFKKEVLSRGSYFIDVYKLTSNKDGENNNIHMCDKVHLSPKCLYLLFENHLCEPNI